MLPVLVGVVFLLGVVLEQQFMHAMHLTTQNLVFVFILKQVMQLALHRFWYPTVMSEIMQNTTFTSITNQAELQRL